GLLPLLRVTQDRGRDHAQAHGQSRIAGNVELAGQPAEGGLVASRKPGAAVLFRARDPGQARIPKGGAPRANAGKRLGLLDGVGLLEDAHLIAALAPLESAPLLGSNTRVA